MDTPNPLRKAHLLTLTFGVLFTLWTIALLVLAITVPQAREERLGFAVATFAAALAHWIVCYLLAKARSTRR